MFKLNEPAPRGLELRKPVSGTLGLYSNIDGLLIVCVCELHHSISEQCRLYTLTKALNGVRLAVYVIVENRKAGAFRSYFVKRQHIVSFSDGELV